MYVICTDFHIKWKSVISNHTDTYKREEVYTQSPKEAISNDNLVLQYKCIIGKIRLKIR